MDYRATVEARAILKQAGDTPSTSQLWLALLQRPYGMALLHSMRLSFSKVEQASFSGEDAKLSLRYAQGLCHITDPGQLCCEQVLHRFLCDREGALGQHLDQLGCRQVPIGEALFQELLEADFLSHYEFADLLALPAAEGRTEPSEGDYVRLCLERSTVAQRVFKRFGVDPVSIIAAAQNWQRIPVISFRGYPSHQIVGPFHLAMALVATNSIQRAMRELGWTATRLEALVRRSHRAYPRHTYTATAKFSVIGPACEEAQRQGHAVVTPADVLLGLLADPDNDACLALEKAGLDLDELRSRHHQPSQGGVGRKEMEFSVEVTVAMHRAAELANSLRPGHLDMLQALLEHAQLFPEQDRALEVIPRARSGHLEPEHLSMLGGQRLGMSAEQMRDPIRRSDADDAEVWHYRDGSAVLQNRRVVGLTGMRLEQNGRVVLQVGDSWKIARALLGVQLRKRWDDVEVAALEDPRGFITLLSLTNAASGSLVGPATPQL
jgi:hypothetical protein